MAETKLSAGSAKNSSPAFERKDLSSSSDSFSSVSAGAGRMAPLQTIWDITSDEITATVLAELRF